MHRWWDGMKSRQGCLYWLPGERQLSSLRCHPVYQSWSRRRCHWHAASRPGRQSREEWGDWKCCYPWEPDARPTRSSPALPVDRTSPVCEGEQIIVSTWINARGYLELYSRTPLEWINLMKPVGCQLLWGGRKWIQIQRWPYFQGGSTTPRFPHPPPPKRNDMCIHGSLQLDKMTRDYLSQHKLF